MADSKTTQRVPGGPVPGKEALLETVASLTQDFTPLKSICAYLNAFHQYADDPSRKVEAQHYCAHISEDVRQCILYDSPERNARLIGSLPPFPDPVGGGVCVYPKSLVEYMITPRLYSTLESSERRLWHSHVFEVKSGELIMPKPTGIPEAVWEVAETKEMESVVQLYGKAYHLWQVDRGDKLPLGEPNLMMSCTQESPDIERLITARDEKLGTDHKRKVELRKHIKEPEVHPDADQWDRSKFT